MPVQTPQMLPKRPVLPVLPTPKLTPEETARVLTQILQNQTVIMNDLTAIKNALPVVGMCAFAAVFADETDTALKQQVSTTSSYWNTQIVNALTGAVYLPWIGVGE